MTRKYKRQSNKPPVLLGETKLPVGHPIAVYYRQSTDAQIGNISTTIQTVDMVAYLFQLGWSNENIIMIDMDGGVSGTTRIDERPGMRTLFGLITDKKISAVACQDEDRLFRDVTQIQVNIFIEACRKSNILVITPSMVYDFGNQLTGTFHARQFRFKSEMAADYINTVIKGKLHRAKQKLISEGRWAGSGIPTGYMVDNRKNLSDGSPNPNWRRYVPFESYAVIVNEYFRMFLLNAGNLRATLREIHKNGPFYSNPKSCLPPPGFKVHYKIYRYKNGFCPGKTGLFELLTNAAYIGHWARNDIIIRWNNHPPIVQKDVFLRAFNYLSAVGLDGRTNRHYTHSQEHARPSREENRLEERPLCAGMIVSKYEGKWHRAGTNWVGPLKHYAYVFWAPGPYSQYVWGKRANYVDEAISKLVIEKLKITFDQNVWDDTLASHRKTYNQARKLKLSQLASLERVIENLLSSLENLENKEMIRTVEDRFENAKSEQKRLFADLEILDNETQNLEKINNLKETYQSTLDAWPDMNRKEKRIIFQSFIKQIEATPIDGQGLCITIQWKDGTSDDIVLPKQATTGTQCVLPFSLASPVR